eukprot:6559524-Heterocapsa_arctica.AAC.1
MRRSNFRFEEPPYTGLPSAEGLADLEARDGLRLISWQGMSRCASISTPCLRSFGATVGSR